MLIQSLRLLFFFFASVCVFIIVYVIYNVDVEKHAFKTQWWPRIAATMYSTRIQRTKAVVLVYTSFFRHAKWVANEDSWCGSDQYNLNKECSLDHFELTYDKTRFFESDLVVFHARNMPSLDQLKSLLRSRPISQRWVYTLWESPNATPDPTPLNGLFNLTWTYRTDSDIWGPYGRYEQLGPEEIKMNKLATATDYSQGKTELVAWMVSNCRRKFKLRISLVYELTKYVKVDVFGHCSSRFGQSRSCSRRDTNKCLKKYKFYLSFENALCEDYITEKYWSRLGNANVVPIVLGGSKYTKLAIPGSYINVMDFKTVKQLSEYLQYLDKNNTAYNEYFNWRLKYKVTANSLSFSLCDICRGFDPGNPPKLKVYDDLKAFWVTDGRCNEKDDQVRNMWGS